MSMAKKKVPVRILHSHNSKLGETKFKAALNKMLIPLLKSKANFYAACSSKAGETLFGKEHFEIIPNIVDIDAYAFDEERRASIRKKENLKADKVIGTVGRLALQKNPFFAVDVFEKVLQKRNDLEYWWIGSGPLDNEVKNYIENKGLTDKIHLLGNRKDVNDLYQGMDVFFLPSLFEGLPLTGIEAQAAGLPCIVSTGIPYEMNISDSVTYLSLTDSIDCWADAICNSLNNGIDRIKANEICNDSCFSKRKSGYTLLKFYNNCLNTEENNLCR